MPRTIQVRYQFTGGESEHEFKNPGSISPRSYNFLPDRRGFLRTYRGSKPLYGPFGPGGEGEDPLSPIAGKWVTAGRSFIDIFGRRRRVIVAGSDIYTIDGYDFTLLFSYPSEVEIEDDGNAHVTIIEHQNHVIFFHPAHPPLKWNGDEPVNWVGVREVPMQPEVHTVWLGSGDPLNTLVWRDYMFGHTDADILTWNAMAHSIWGANIGGQTDQSYVPPVYLQDDQPNGTEGTDAQYQWKVAFQNSNGQVGRWSAPIAWRVRPTDEGDKDKSDEHRKQTRKMPTVEWFRPEDVGPTGIGTDITHTWVARTGNTVADPDAGAYFLQGIYPYTQNRTTDNKAGLSLAIEEDNFAPVNGGLGCKWREILFLSGNRDDPHGVWYSKPGFWEAWPGINYYKASDIVTAVLPLSDRVVVVTESTIEVLSFDAQSSQFGLFRKDDRRGSMLGRSLVVYKDNIFGLFTDGYGLFDGFQYKGVDSDQDELFSYIDRHNADRVMAVVDPKSGYWCTVNFDAKTASGSTLVLHFDFTNNAWYRVKDSGIMSIWHEDEDIVVGGYENVFLFDKGGGSDEGALLEIAKTEFSETDSRASVVFKSVRAIYLLTGSTANLTADVDFYADENLSTPLSTGTYSLRGSAYFSFQDSRMDPAWDSAIWDSDGAEWVAPRRVWQKVVDFTDDVRFYSVRTAIKVPADTYAEVAGIGYDLELTRNRSGVP